MDLHTAGLQCTLTYFNGFRFQGELDKVALELKRQLNTREERIEQLEKVCMILRAIGHGIFNI